MVNGFQGALESIQHDYDGLTFITSADYLVVEGTSRGRMSGKRGKPARLLAGVSATSSSFEMAESRGALLVSNSRNR